VRVEKPPVTPDDSCPRNSPPVRPIAQVADDSTKKQHVSGGAATYTTTQRYVGADPQHNSLQTASIMPPSFLFGVRRTLARGALPSRKTATGQRRSICQLSVASIGGCDSAPLVRMKFLTIFPVHFSAWTRQTPLRLMPLGGSITHSVGSSDQNGYRKVLLDLLRDDGFNVLMVGSRKAGTMSNNEHEGWRGFRIDQIERRAVPSAEKLRPHLFTVNAGSNDCLQDYQMDCAHERVARLLEGLWQVCPDSTIILSSLLVNRDAQVDKRIQGFNHELTLLAEAFAQAGRKITFADMHSLDGPATDDLRADDTHPDDVGYEKMAHVWRKSIQEASAKRFL
jgi:lysophospholipase L1-like esterase